MKNAVIVSGLVVVGLSVSVSGATLVVDINGGGPYTAIQPALDAAAKGDTIIVRPGEYAIEEPLDFNRLFKPDDPASPRRKDLVLRSEGGPEVTILRMAAAPADPTRGSVFLFRSGETAASVLEGFTLTGGSGTRLRQNYTVTAGGAIGIVNGSSPRISSRLRSGRLAAS